MQALQPATPKLYFALLSARQDVARSLKTVSQMNAKTDEAEREVLSTLRRLASRLPKCSQEMVASEVCVAPYLYMRICEKEISRLIYYSLLTLELFSKRALRKEMDSSINCQRL